MEHSADIIPALAGILLLGIGAQCLAWSLRLPSILVLLAAGLFAGPVTGWLSPDAMFGQLLLPGVSLAVGIILFEGGLRLRLAELRHIGRPLFGLLTVGALVTWVLSALAAHRILGLSVEIATLLGAILIVTGPTVIGPMLQFIRPVGKVATIARWEGIVIDPLGAVLAVLTFEAVQSVASQSVLGASLEALEGLLLTLLAGGGVGFFVAWLLSLLLVRHIIPDHLRGPVTMTAVVASFAFSNWLQPESGLVTVTLMGVVLANQSSSALKEIEAVGENLAVLLISSLFIVLTARLQLHDFMSLGWGGGLFVLLLIVVIRPVSVFLGTMGSGLNWQEKTFLAWLAPRGIVAAAVASVFASELRSGGEAFSAAVFLVIVSTVGVYALTSGAVARKLGLSIRNPQGVLLAGANNVARHLAEAIQRLELDVILVDTNRANVQTARMRGLQAFEANILSDRALEELPIAGIGRFIALTSNDEVNTLACQHMSEFLSTSQIFRVSSDVESNRSGMTNARLEVGRVWGSCEWTYERLNESLRAHADFHATPLTEKFGYDAFVAMYPDAIVFMTLTKADVLLIRAAGESSLPVAGDTVLSLVQKEDEAAELNLSSQGG